MHALLYTVSACIYKAYRSTEFYFQTFKCQKGEVKDFQKDPSFIMALKGISTHQEVMLRPGGGFSREFGFVANLEDEQVSKHRVYNESGSFRWLLPSGPFILARNRTKK